MNALTGIIVYILNWQCDHGNMGRRLMKRVKVAVDQVKVKIQDLRKPHQKVIQVKVVKVKKPSQLQRPLQTLMIHQWMNSLIK